MAAAVGSCSKDNPFDGDYDGSTGKLLKSSLTMSLENENGPRSLRDRNIRMAPPKGEDFAVDFIKVGADEPTLTYEKYSEMPEIVVLPVGEYTAVAHYGNNPDAAWESPYYKGESTVFSIVKDDITDNVEPITCSLSNVRVSIKFDDALLAVMDDDCSVNVKVGEKGSLDFTKYDTDRSGYFAYVDDSQTLVAVFTGVVDGATAKETKSYTDVKPGNHYKITFRLHDAGEEDPGQIGGKDGDEIIIVDATVETENMNQEDLDDSEQTIPDTMRPTETPEQPEDPGTEEPGDDDSNKKPSIVAQAPYNIDVMNDLQDGVPVVVDVTSYAQGGITGFEVVIDSTTLDPETLEGVDLTDHLDLVTPGQYEKQLEGLGLPVNVGGKQNVQFSITTMFIDLLKLLGEGTHKFVLTVTDANGTTVKTLQVHNYGN